MSKTNGRFGRRAVLEAGAAGIAASVAGCVGGTGPDDGNGSDSPGGSDGESGSGATAGSGGGSDYPSRQIELVIPYGTAGGYNAYTRLVGPYLKEALGAPEIVYNNIVGAGGRVATREVYNADPDGYTMMLMNGDNVALQEVIYDLDYDVLEMTYFPQVTQESTLFGLTPDLGIETWDDYVSAVQNDELKFGSESPTSSGVIAPVMAGVNSGAYEPERVIDNFVQYPTKNEMIAGIRRGNINVIASSYSSVLPFVDSGDLDPFLVTLNDESPPEQTPDAATLATESVESAEQIESATKGIRVFAGPPDVPEDRATTIREAYTSAFEHDELRQKAAEIDRPIRPTTAEEARTAVSQKIESNEAIADLLTRLSGEK